MTKQRLISNPYICNIPNCKNKPEMIWKDKAYICVYHYKVMLEKESAK